MAVTSNRGLPLAATDGDIYATDQSRLAYTSDLTEGNIAKELLAKGCLVESAGSGWQIAADKTVSAGKGLVGTCWCANAVAQLITNLTNSAVNYVFAVAQTTSAWDNSVVFQAQTVYAITAGRVYLGTITLDSGGTVTATSNVADGADERNLYPLERREVSGVWPTPSGADDPFLVDVGGWAVVEIDHSATVNFHTPLGVDVDADPQCSVWQLANYNDAGKFRLRVQNDYAVGGEYIYGSGWETGSGTGSATPVVITWRRWGLSWP
jgi:hypothetical protein